MTFEVINLDRRPERLRSFEAMAAIADPRLPERVTRRSAVDGQQLVPSADLLRSIDGNDFGSRRGVVGCALSHVAAWRDAARRAGEVTVVLEDDVRLATGFTDEVTSVLAAAGGPAGDWDLIAFGYTSWDYPAVPLRSPGGSAGVRDLRWGRYLGGLFAYAVTASGAARLAAIVDRVGLRESIDCTLRSHRDGLSALEVDPPIAFAVVANGSVAGVPTDVQLDDGALIAPTDHRPGSA